MAEGAHGPGTMVTPRIRLLRKLGEGGMGTVWVADHLGLSTRVAVKFVARELYFNHDIAKRFVREASSAARISSPHVVRTFDFGAMDDGTPFLVMELLEGESLADRIARGPLPASEVVVITSHVAKALEEAHQLGIVHRDIKPANIFLTRSGRELFAKVLDFGIARDTEAAPSMATRSGVLLGTPQYMSPEQLMSSKAADAHADLWALAVTAYEAMVGTPPFGGETMPSLVVAIHARQFEPPSTSKRGAALGLSPALDGFFARAFSISAEERFPSAAALAEALSAACAGTAPPPPSPVEAGRTRYGAPIDIPVVAAPSAFADTGVAPSLPRRTTLGSASTSSTLPSHGAPVARLPRRAPPRASRAPWLVAGAALLLAAVALAWATMRTTEPRAAKPASSAADVEEPDHETEWDKPAPSARDVGADVAGAAASAALPRVLSSLTIAVAEGTSPQAGAWLPSFDLEREAEPKPSVLAALDACRGRGSALCTEPQWKAACATDGRLASHSTWLATLDAGRLVARGGSDCAKRDVVATTDATPRAIACCERAVATVGSDAGFLRATSAKILAWENAMNSGRSDAVAALYDDEVDFLGTRRSKAELERLGVDYFRQNPVQSTAYGSCEVAALPGVDQWRAVCSTFFRRAGDIYGLDQSFVFGGVSGKAMKVGESRVVKLK